MRLSMKQIKIKFNPQMWLNDYTTSADPEGETEFFILEKEARELTGFAGQDWADFDADSYEGDNLRYASTAPAWIKDWHGPFYHEVLGTEEGVRNSIDYTFGECV